MAEPDYTLTIEMRQRAWVLPAVRLAAFVTGLGLPVPQRLLGALVARYGMRWVSY